MIFIFRAVIIINRQIYLLQQINGFSQLIVALMILHSVYIYFPIVFVTIKLNNLCFLFRDCLKDMSGWFAGNIHRDFQYIGVNGECPMIFLFHLHHIWWIKLKSKSFLLFKRYKIVTNNKNRVFRPASHSLNWLTRYFSLGIMACFP